MLPRRGIDRIRRQGLEGDGRDELGRRGRHRHGDLRPRLCEPRNNGAYLIDRDPAGNRDEYGLALKVRAQERRIKPITRRALPSSIA